MANRKYPNARQAKKAQRLVNNNYKKRAYKCMAFRFHNENDADVIAKLNSVDNKLGYIKRLIREDIEKNG